MMSVAVLSVTMMSDTSRSGSLDTVGVSTKELVVVQLGAGSQDTVGVSIKELVVQVLGAGSQVTVGVSLKELIVIVVVQGVRSSEAFLFSVDSKADS